MISEIRSRLRQEVAERAEMPVENIDENTHLADLGIDSLQALQLLVLLERDYQITIGDEDLKHFTSITSIVNLVDRRLQLSECAASD
jgi:acyl carrier protein